MRLMKRKKKGFGFPKELTPSPTEEQRERVIDYFGEWVEKDKFPKLESLKKRQKTILISLDEIIRR